MNDDHSPELPRQLIIGRELATSDKLDTPAFIYDEAGLMDACTHLRSRASHAGCRALFAMKSFSVPDALRAMAPHLDGFATSSVFESRLAREILEKLPDASATVHITSPGISPRDGPQVLELCDHVSFNSLSQRDHLMKHAVGSHRQPGCSLGLRINPELSFLEDARYDPCRQYSKLGESISRVRTLLDTNPSAFRGISGVHIHNNCEAETLDALAITVSRLTQEVGDWLSELAWINLGGGYDYCDESSALSEIVGPLKNHFGLEVFIEPGCSISRPHGHIVTSVVDVMQSGDKQMVVLDTSVNHMPEVFEYQYEPDVVDDYYGGEYEYLLAGSTCLAGDVFGLYGFDRKLEVGSRLVFPDMGAYTLVKAHAFNGIALPAVYARTPKGRLVFKSAYTYDDFKNRCGG